MGKVSNDQTTLRVKLFSFIKALSIAARDCLGGLRAHPIYKSAKRDDGKYDVFKRFADVQKVLIAVDAADAYIGASTLPTPACVAFPEDAQFPDKIIAGVVTLENENSVQQKSSPIEILKDT